MFAVSETGGQYKIRKKFAEMIDYVKKNKSKTEQTRATHPSEVLTTSSFARLPSLVRDTGEQWELSHAKKNKYYEVRRGELEAAKKQIQRRQRNLFDKYMDSDSTNVVGITPGYKRGFRHQIGGSIVASSRFDVSR
mgnify:CR=1 FL=1